MTRLETEIFSRHEKTVLAALRSATVGVAGAGGLGSNVAVSLARAGVGRLILADFDKIEPSNLNRQQFAVRQIGKRKAAALAANLKLIAPFTAVKAYDAKVGPANIEKLFGGADILIEAFDRAEEKGMLINAWLKLHPDRPVIAASGLAGYGGNSKLKTRRMGSLYICGDGASQCPPGISPMAPRVALVANMQANLAVELLMKIKGKKNV
ncbi:MAG TPA: thiamine biosynthesis protein ThiF [Elusimicrobia bacterium]|nr:MAG: thiamine biosynthesis protein ThiF [Elusimicrobia bacterium GWD2_63_28]HCC48102.1 thiamine biosynthesis protein ThiF [Elusimicrobiota bacterium]